ncbi:glycoside hydrolase family 3 N-terminal domain-containing protein [Arenibacter sp. GZD96]|uniref:glycoside hydrolase family 3 protein n=1 Tax=Aurantibrevibacter litoralis TaxID=3106030 RepID=UPI002AFF93AE|nr:glycoside hydrolase family 3 N-terminal domain-containing protein [Arenibacter sp. GZD-96]MEA1786019.1 glycoside hydrolase family 3 N-terminal domain-containing protein [Arenibacter sp. GZD-96]
MKLKDRFFLQFFLVGVLVLSGCKPKYTTEEKEGFVLIKNKEGKTLGYNTNSGVRILEVDRFAFKDLNKNGQLDAYEDWRLPVEERAKDLSKKLSTEEIAGLMLYSSHQSIPGGANRAFGPVTYNGKSFAESGALASDLSDAQKEFLEKDNLRHVLITTVESPGIAAQWNNNAQAFAEKLGFGIPVNTSSDPRHGSDASAEFNAGAGGKISMWPHSLGLTATFDIDLMKQFGEIASKEYRALGITTALSPQIDLGTEPRWYRYPGTMGEDPNLAAAMARAYVDGFQSSNDNSGWGFQSVNAMVKHWPGGGPEEGGRDGHFGYGAYAVYPGNNFKDHIKPFTEGAFKLEGPTKMASAVMPYYTISFGQDTKNNDNVANGFNKYLITDVLRGQYGYEGVLCTDWGITRDISAIDVFEGKPWGVEQLTEAERHFKVIEAGMDQFGGNNDIGPILEAYQMGVTAHGEAYMRIRFETSAVRLLRNIFNVDLFENPYLEVSETEKTVGNPNFMQAGFEAQVKSVILLKNQDKTLPLKARLKVYVPQRYVPSTKNWWGIVTPAKTEYPFNLEIVKKYFEVVENPAEADFALVGIKSPDGGVGYDRADLEKGGNGYVPITLQYGEYTASTAREVSLAGGSPLENFTNRSYKGKKVIASNHSDMKLVNDTKKLMGNKPVIVSINVSNPMVFSEIEPSASGILVHMGVQDQALMDLITGQSEPYGLLPFQMPADMLTVEAQKEDVPRDMTPFTDTEGNTYDFAFGLNWEGIINDERVTKYK